MVVLATFRGRHLQASELAGTFIFHARSFPFKLPVVAIATCSSSPRLLRWSPHVAFAMLQRVFEQITSARMLQKRPPSTMPQPFHVNSKVTVCRAGRGTNTHDVASRGRLMKNTVQCFHLMFGIQTSPFTYRNVRPCTFLSQLQKLYPFLMLNLVVQSCVSPNT